MRICIVAVKCSCMKPPQTRLYYHALLYQTHVVPGGLESFSESSMPSLPNRVLMSRTFSRKWSRGCLVLSSAIARVSRMISWYPSSLGSHQWLISGICQIAAKPARNLGEVMYLVEFTCQLMSTTLGTPRAACICNSLRIAVVSGGWGEGHFNITHPL